MHASDETVTRLRAERAALAQAVTDEKRAIQIHRRRLREIAAALKRHEAVCREFGIGFRVHSSTPDDQA